MLKFIAGITAFIVPTIVHAQEAAAEVAKADGGDTFASIYLAIGGIVLMALTWLITWGVGKLKGSRMKETAGRFLSHFNTGLEGAHARFKMKLEAARDPNSPGGTVITDAEWDGIRGEMWDYLKKQYGSMGGIMKVVGIFTGSSSEDAVKAFVDSKIDGGIANLERAEKAASNPK